MVMAPYNVNTGELADALGEKYEVIKPADITDMRSLEGRDFLAVIDDVTPNIEFLVLMAKEMGKRVLLLTDTGINNFKTDYRNLFTTARPEHLREIASAVRELFGDRELLEDQ